MLEMQWQQTQHYLTAFEDKITFVCVHELWNELSYEVHTLTKLHVTTDWFLYSGYYPEMETTKETNVLTEMPIMHT